MADMLASGAAWLAGQLKGAAGRTVTYQRGGNAVDVTATIGRSEFQSQTTSGAIEVWESRDYLITFSDLPYGEPIRGDLIIEEIGDDLATYEVSSPRGIPVFHADAFRTICRVHTTQTDAGLVYLLTEAGEQLLTEAGEQLVA